MGQILVVHDEEKRRAEISSALRGIHSVSLAESVTQAIAILKAREALASQTQPFDLIICCVHIDSGADNLTVFDLLKWCKGNPQVQTVPFVLLCSEPSRHAQYVSDSVQLASQALGGAGYLKFQQFDPLRFSKIVEAYLTEPNTTGTISKELTSAQPDRRYDNDGHADINIAVDLSEQANPGWQT